MAQANANREPTMEEILASIRRIIESNDEAAERPSARGYDGRGNASSVAAEESHAASLEYPTEREERSRAPDLGAETRALPADGQDHRPVSLADVAARVRAAGGAAVPASAAASSGPSMAARLHSHGNVAVRSEPYFAYSPDAVEAWDEAGEEDADEAPAVAANDHAASARQPEPEASQPDPADEAPSDDDVDTHIRAVLRASVVEEMTAIPDRSGEEAADKPDTAATNSDTPTGGTHLMSAGAGAKVAAAFDDLSDVFTAGPSRSFDEMAEEMLRPMLQQWLDDNLPTLVERLVREEIERVARGSRR